MRNLRRAACLSTGLIFLLTVLRRFLSCNFYTYICGQSIVYMGCIVFRIKCLIVHMFMSCVLLFARDGFIDCLRFPWMSSVRHLTSRLWSGNGSCTKLIKSCISIRQQPKYLYNSSRNSGNIHLQNFNLNIINSFKSMTLTSRRLRQLYLQRIKHWTTMWQKYQLIQFRRSGDIDFTHFYIKL